MNRREEGSRWAVWLSSAAAFAIIGCTWALATARYGGPDEPAHIIRAAAAAHGDLLGKPVERLEPGYRQVTAPAKLATGDPACFRHSETTTAECGNAERVDGDVQVATSAGAAPPWYHAIIGGVARSLTSGDGVMPYRMATVMLCAVVLGTAMVRSRRLGGAAWLVAAFTPSAWFLIGVVGTSAIEIALVALALVEAVGRLRDPGTSASLARVSVPLAACLVLRPAAVIDIAVVALAVAPSVRPFTRRRLAALLLPLIIAGAATLAWNRWTGLIVSDRRTADSDELIEALRRSLGGIPLTAHQAVGALGWNEFFAPVAAQVVWIATLAWAAYWTFTHSRRWWHVCWFAAAVLLPTLLEVIVHDRIGEIWQGRYSIPFAMGGVLFAASSVDPPRRFLRCVVIAAACAEVLTLWQTLRRYMVGLDGSNFLQHAAWSPPINAWLLLAINAAAIAWLGSIALASPDPATLTLRLAIADPHAVLSDQTQ